jgi:recombination protein RecA
MATTKTKSADAASAKDQALDKVIAEIRKRAGADSIMRFAGDYAAEIPVIPTGSLSLDIALGVGGVPRGRVVEIYGPEASGKTTLALHMIANAQRRGGIAAFIDAEHALDPGYARRLGVNLEALLISQPDYGEQALQIAELLVSSNSVDIVVIDSVAALVPKAELDGEIGDTHVGLQARLMSQALRKLAGAIRRSRTCVVFINQIRMKIGVMFGSPETTTGGRALKFYASVRIDIRNIGKIKSGDEVKGNRILAKVVKNKVAPPFRNAEFEIIYNQGIDHTGDVVDLAVNHKLINRSGAWYSYGEEKLGQGRDNVVDLVREKPELAEELEAKILATVGLKRILEFAD